MRGNIEMIFESWLLLAVANCCLGSALVLSMEPRFRRRREIKSLMKEAYKAGQGYNLLRERVLDALARSIPEDLLPDIPNAPDGSRVYGTYDCSIILDDE